MRSTHSGHQLRVVERALGRRAWVTDQAGGAADQDDRLVAGALQRTQHHELHEVPDVQARRRGVEAAVVGDRPRREVRRAARASSVLWAISPRRCRSSIDVASVTGTILPGRAPRPDRRRPPRTEHAHRRRAGLAEPPRQVGRPGDADPGPGGDRGRRRPPVQPDRATPASSRCGVPVVGADAQGLGQPGGPARQVAGRPAAPGGGRGPAPPPPRPPRRAAAPPSRAPPARRRRWRTSARRS